MTRHILICLPLLLGGCGATLFGPEPGLTDLSITTPDGLSLDWESGKEFGSIEGTYTRPDGTVVTFKAAQVEAFAGQAILLEMQRQQLAAMASMLDLLKGLAAGMASGGLAGAPPQ